MPKLTVEGLISGRDHPQAAIHEWITRRDV
jgi:hypothetical protein